MSGRVPVHTGRPVWRPPGPGSHADDIDGIKAIEAGAEHDGQAAGDRGAVTVEAALALCSLAVFLAVAVGSVAAVAAHVRCIDAARELARLAARGETELGHTVAGRLAPSGARTSLTREGDLVVADVSAELLHPLPLRLGGRAVAALEPGATAP